MAKQKIQDAVPDGVRGQIATHLREESKHAEQGWESAPTSEDVLTGDLGRALKTGWSDPIEDNGYQWRWRVTYRKLGAGNQYSSEEHATGADGVFQVEVKRFKVEVLPASPQTFSVENIVEDYEFRKGVLFQSKRYDSNGASKLFDEVKKIEQLTPGAGVCIEYGPNQYRASPAKSVFNKSGVMKDVPTEEVYSLGDFLADQFLECRVGVEGMYVDLAANPQVLHFPEGNAAITSLGPRLGHALSVQVSAFKMVRFTGE